MKNLILLMALVSCTVTVPSRSDKGSNIERTKGCVTEIMERFGETSKEALETCLAIYRRK